MAITRSNTLLDVALDASRSMIHQKYNNFLEARARRKVFRTTYSELAKLSDRELRDLGLPRASLKRIAMEAAYDC